MAKTRSSLVAKVLNIIMVDYPGPNRRWFATEVHAFFYSPFLQLASDRSDNVHWSSCRATETSQFLLPASTDWDCSIQWLMAQSQRDKPGHVINDQPVRCTVRAVVATSLTLHTTRLVAYFQQRKALAKWPKVLCQATFRLYKNALKSGLLLLLIRARQLVYLGPYRLRTLFKDPSGLISGVAFLWWSLCIQEVDFCIDMFSSCVCVFCFCLSPGLECLKSLDFLGLPVYKFRLGLRGFAFVYGVIFVYWLVWDMKTLGEAL